MCASPAVPSLSDRGLYRRGLTGLETSGWLDGTEPLHWQRLEGKRQAEVVIVGAGLTGASLALELVRRGCDVVLLDAAEPGWGASGRNAGHVVPIRDLDRALGTLADNGEQWLDLLRGGPERIQALIADNKIGCFASFNGYIQAAHRSAAVSRARSKSKKWADRGFPVRYIEGDELRERTGSRSFHAGVLCEAGGSLNPYLFNRGLASVAQDNGASVFANSPVAAIIPDGSRWKVQAPNGTVHSERVVLCTNGYTGDVVPELERAWCPLVAYGLVSNPIPETIAETVLPDGLALSLFPTGLHPAVVDSHRRIVSSLLVPVSRPHSSGAALRSLRRWLRRTFPQVDTSEIVAERYWTGSMAWSTDTLPRLFEPQPGLLALTCMSGEGNLIAPLLGTELGHALARDRLEDFVLPVQQPSPVRFRSRYDVGLRRLAVPLLGLAEKLKLY